MRKLLRSTQHCLARVWTADLERQIYGSVVSESIAEHISRCDRCRYIDTGDHAALAAWRAGGPPERSSP